MSFNPATISDYVAMPELPGVRRRLWGDAWTGWVLCITLVLCAVAWSFQLLTFTHAKEGVLAVGVALASLGLIARGAMSTRALRALLPLWLGLLTAVWMGLFVKGVQRPEAVLEEAVRILVILTAALIAYDLLEQQRWRRRFRAALVASGVGVVLLGLLQFAGLAQTLFPVAGPNDQAVYSVFGNQDFFGGYAAIMLALAVAPAIGRTPRGWWWALAAMVLFMGVAISSSRSAWLAAGAGVFVAGWVARPRVAWGRAITCALVALAMAGAVMVKYPERTVERVVGTMRPGDDGGHLRLWFWSGALHLIDEQPFLGAGLGNFGYWSPHYQGEALAAPGGHLLAHNTIHTVHAHSEPLEIFAETGLLGMVFMVWMLLRLLKRRGPEWAGLTALLVFVLFNSSLHSPPFGVAGSLLAVMLIARGGRLPLISEDSTAFPGLVTGLACALLVAVAWTVLIPSYRLTRAEAIHVGGGDAITLYEKAIHHGWPLPEAHEGLAIALYERGDHAGARSQLLLAQRGVDTGRLHLLLGRVSLLLEEPRLARESMRRVLARWPWHAEAWRVLYAGAGEEERAVLEDHAARWGIHLEGGAEDTVGEHAGNANTY
jgi:hypothetical protein